MPEFPRSLEVIKKEAKAKMKICLQCEEMNKAIKTCKQCNCFLPAKVLVPGLHCPLDKW